MQRKKCPPCSGSRKNYYYVGGVSDIARYLGEQEVNEICVSHRNDALRQLQQGAPQRVDPAKLWRKAVKQIMEWNRRIYREGREAVKDQKQSD